MSIQTVERVLGNEDMLRVTMTGGTVYHVPDDPKNSHRRNIAEWQAQGGTIAAPSAVERRADVLRDKAEQAIRYAEWRRAQYESEAARAVRLDRTTLYAAAAVNGTPLTPELEAAAAIDMVTAHYLIQIKAALDQGLAALRDLTTLAGVRAWDPRTDITWPIPPT